MLASLGFLALLCTACSSSRRTSRTTARSDSILTSITERTDYEPIPVRQATLTLTATQLDTLAALPRGFGRSLHHDGLHLDVTADGQGGIDVTARADSSARRVSVFRKEQHRTTVREESTTDNRSSSTHSASVLVWVVFVAVVALAVRLAILFGRLR